MLNRIAMAAFGARYGDMLVSVHSRQRQIISGLEEENAELRRINLDLGRACLNLCYGLLTEINDPGTLSEDHILAAATDWADQIARMEEHTV